VHYVAGIGDDKQHGRGLCHVFAAAVNTVSHGPLQGFENSAARGGGLHQQHTPHIYHIKTLMIKRELAKDPAMANENWDRYVRGL